MIANKRLQLAVNEDGYISELFVKDDPYQMNWVIESEYLQEMSFDGKDKLFGNFTLDVDGTKANSKDLKPVVKETEEKITVSYELEDVNVQMEYDLSQDEETLYWNICLKNKTEKNLEIKDFGVWIAYAYIMFRDKNVHRNIHNSAAVFSSISPNYTKLNAVRRDNQGGHLGMYQVKGETLSVGTYCDYLNLFFENASPSLDGMLFHKLILAGGYPDGFENKDWIYRKDGFILQAKEERIWEYAIKENKSHEDFLDKGLELGHAKMNYTPLNMLNEPVRVSVEVPENKNIVSAEVYFKENDTMKSIAISVEGADKKCDLVFKPVSLGEHKVEVTFTDGTKDFVVLNVMDSLEKVINERVEYICNELYNGPTGKTPYAFEPVSNQGESLGKLNLVLKKNILGELDASQVRKVEESVVKYVRPKWFMDGDFKKPIKLYGDFYRCMDFEYIAHLFYLLSEFDKDVLVFNSPETYLEWAADVFELRVNPELHEDERGKEEAEMLGVYFLYIKELLSKLKEQGLEEKYNTIKFIWEKVIDRVDSESETYKAAITEHYYDNAGFGPTAGALSESGKYQNADRYGQLLLANIGCSNDFRAQNPDRWWEALTYMIHSLWGGVTAASTFKVYELLKNVEYLEASYRATAAVLYCYDTHSTAAKSLEKGRAASTYAVAGPHLNRPDLSRERFGQSTFFRDGGIFARLFENDSQTPDWDMGEEIVAYMDSFGQKTYIVKEENGIRVINGSYEEKDGEYVITSFAPYSKEFYLVSENEEVLLEAANGQRTITLKI